MADLATDAVLKAVSTLARRIAAGSTLTPEQQLVHALGSEVIRWRRLYLDQPEDRLYHAKDGTWWSRDDSHYTGVGSLVAAHPPEFVVQMQESLEHLQNILEEATGVVREALGEDEELEDEEEEEDGDEEDTDLDEEEEDADEEEEDEDP